jgi:hypothetical protein
MPEIGQNLSHYKLVEKIGKGGSNQVPQPKVPMIKTLMMSEGQNAT